MSRPETRLKTRTRKMQQEMNRTENVVLNREENEPNRVAGEEVSRTYTTSNSRKSSRSAASVVVAKKKAELDAAKKLAELQKTIIEKELELKIAELSVHDDDSIAKSYHTSSSKERRTENWVYSQPHKFYEESPNHLKERRPEFACSDNNNESRESDIKALARQLKQISRPTELPIFQGHVNEWILFKSAYDRSKKFSKDDEEIVMRLQRCLRGDAHETVASLLQINAPAADIIEALELRYGRPELILHEQIKAVKELPRVYDSSEQLSKFACKVRNCVATIKSLNKPEQLYNTELVQAVKMKIPHLKSDWLSYAKQHEEDNVPELVKLSEFLQAQSTALTKFWIAEPLKTAYCSRTTPIHKTFCADDDDEPINLNPHSNNEQETCCVAPNLPPSELENKMCPYCQSQNHKNLTECEKFKKLPVDERWNWAKEVKFCFKCLRSRHRRENCRAKPCGINGCRMSHCRLLHVAPRDPQQVTCSKAEEAEENMDSSDHMPAVNTCKVFKNKNCALLQVVPVEVCGPTGKKKTFALLDGGSTLTLIKDNIATEVGAVGTTEPLILSGINGTTHEQCSKRVNIEVVGPSKEIVSLRGARTVKDLPLSPQTLSSLEQYEYLRDLPLEDICYEHAVPELLIGQDNWHAIIARKVKTGKSSEPVASLTALGWVIHGFVSSATNVVNFVGCIKEEDTDLRELIENYFRIDSMGLSEEKLCNEDKRAMNILETTARRVESGKRWEVGLLWREDDPVMPESYANAAKRLRLVEKKMDLNPAYGLKYKENMDKFINSGYASPCKPTESPKKFYLPHFGVTNENKPGKLRIVHDAACKVNGVSLNDKLLTGPDLLLPLLEIIFKFREGKYAVSADIKEMFSQVRIRSEDRPAQRFLWREFDRSRPPIEHEMNSVIFGATCSPATAIHIMRRNAEDFASRFPEALEAIRTRFYMDDYLHSFHTEEDALRISNEVNFVNSEGGFELTQWMSNNKKIMQSIPPEKRGSGRVEFDANTIVKTLGLRWNPSDDTLGFNLLLSRIPGDILNGTKIPTKRQALKVIMSLFDPLGILAPILIQGKMLFQKMVHSGIDWDQKLPDTDVPNWYQWLERLKASYVCRVPRHYHPDPLLTTIELHTFCDASQKAIAAVSYWKFTDPNGSIHTCLAASKCKVTPLKPITIPRLELEAALLGAKIANLIIKGHDAVLPSKRYFWTDSAAVAAWIKGDPRSYKTYVANRLGVILELSKPTEWHWLPTSLNVADDATRGVKTLKITDRWFTGPMFLLDSVEKWATDKTVQTLLHDPEKKKTADIVNVIQSIPSHLPSIERFSKWSKLIRSTAYILVFIEASKTKSRPGLHVRHIIAAETLWIKHSQELSFPLDISLIKFGENLSNRSKLYKLGPFIDYNGILRLKGRAQASNLSRNLVEPVILDGRNRYTKLLIQHYHNTFLHGNCETVINELRLKYWIIRLRPSVKTVQRECQICRIRKATPSQPQTGDLPLARLSHHQRPFTHCGVDYFGPLIVTIGRRREKRYGSLFTCLTTRAVHIELAGSLTTDSAILALRRMMARRGQPENLYSDNGTNFRGADVELKRAINDLETNCKYKDFLLSRRIQWHFIPPASPHMGGCWERLVRSIKKCLSVALHELAPSEEILRTVLAEAENVVNSRPLTHVSVHPDDLEAITPNHFLILGPTNVNTPGTFTNLDLCDRKYWKKSQVIADAFWKRWVREYLPTLLPRQIFSKDEDLKPGDVVIVADSDMPRNVWPRGIIEKIYPGPDGRVRVVDVRTIAGVLKRPAVKIARLPVLNSS